MLTSLVLHPEFDGESGMTVCIIDEMKPKKILDGNPKSSDYLFLWHPLHLPIDF